MFRERLLFPAALVCSTIANVHRDIKEHPEPFSPAYFMPGFEIKTREQELREWAEAIERGEAPESDPEEIEEFKANMQHTFNLTAPADDARH